MLKMLRSKRGVVVEMLRRVTRGGRGGGAKNAEFGRYVIFGWPLGYNLPGKNHSAHAHPGASLVARWICSSNMTDKIPVAVLAFPPWV